MPQLCYYQPMTIPAWIGPQPAVNSMPTVTAPDQPLNLMNFTINNSVYCYTTGIDISSLGSTTAILQIQNPVNSGKQLCITRIVGGTTDLPDNAAVYSLYANPTIGSSGSVVAAVLRNVGGSGSAVAVVQVRPTASNFGTLLEAVVCGETGRTIEMTVNYDVIVQPGNSVLLRGQPLGVGQTAYVSVIWAELAL